MSEGIRFEDVALRANVDRLRVIASNIANADTPGYAARATNFAETLERASAKAVRLKSTSASHLSASQGGGEEELLYREAVNPSMDGNTVDLDVERAAFVQASIRTQFAMRQAVDEYEDMSKMLKGMVG